MKISLNVVLLVVAPLIAAPSVHACNCTGGSSIADKFQEADEVFLAMVVSGHRHGEGHDPSDLYAEEEVTFRVLYSWKGRWKPDSFVKTKTGLGLGSCGLSVENDWHWPDYKLSTDAVAAGGTWLLFVQRNEPVRLSSCSGSESLTEVKPTELSTLFSLLPGRRRPTEKP